MALQPGHGQPAPQVRGPEEDPARLQAQSSTDTSEKENNSQGGGFLVFPIRGL